MGMALEESQVSNLLVDLYSKALDGIPRVDKSVEDLALDYLEKYDTREKAAKALIYNQIAKCSASGFLAGFGGIVTLPVMLPANIVNVLYVQIRMVAAIAWMGGYNIYSDQVQTLVYACLVGNSVSNVMKQTGIKIGEKITTKMIEKISREVISTINQKVGFRLLTKFGEKGVVNLVKLVPVAGGVIGGAFDAGTTKIIAANAYHLFIENKMK